MNDDDHLHSIIFDYGDACAEMQAELDRLRAENEALRKVVKAAAKFSAHTSWAEVHVVGAGARETLRTIGGMED